jgi:hypothetical protein
LDDLFADTDHAETRPPISVNVSILPNAQIVVGKNNVEINKSKESKEENERLAHALDIAGDLDVWVGFLRTQAV